MEQRHALEGVMDTSMKNLKEIVDANTVIGDPVTTPTGTVIIPVSKVSFGFASGGSDFNTKNGVPDKPVFGGGSGAGVNINPIAFLVVRGDNVRLLYVAPPIDGAVDRVVDMVPELVDKVTGFIEKQQEKKDNVDF